MKLYYVSTRQGCTIRKASSLAAAIRSVARDVGSNNVQDGRIATDKDIAWVRGMGGYVPATARGEHE